MPDATLLSAAAHPTVPSLGAFAHEVWYWLESFWEWANSVTTASVGRNHGADGLGQTGDQFTPEPKVRQGPSFLCCHLLLVQDVTVDYSYLHQPKNTLRHHLTDLCKKL